MLLSSERPYVDEAVSANDTKFDVIQKQVWKSGSGSIDDRPHDRRAGAHTARKHICDLPSAALALLVCWCGERISHWSKSTAGTRWGSGRKPTMPGLS